MQNRLKNAKIKNSMQIAENIAKIEERIQRACQTAGRKREEITLMGVTKFQPLIMVEEAWNVGIRYFGESRVQEGIAKFEGFRKEHPDLHLHLIGSLQRNKVKTAVNFFDCIQSVDRDELIVEIAKHSERPLDVLLELHTGEDSKSGFKSFDSLFSAAELILGSANIRPRGLMTMAPYTQDEGMIRTSFRFLVSAQKELEMRFPPKSNWACLSMGMSNDFEIAVEEGATMLRIGSLIFGEK